MNVKWQTIWKIICQFFKKLSIELSYDPVIPILRYLLKKIKFICLHKNMNPTLFIVAKVKTTQISMS